MLENRAELADLLDVATLHLVDGHQQARTSLSERIAEAGQRFAEVVLGFGRWDGLEPDTDTRCGNAAEAPLGLRRSEPGEEIGCRAGETIGEPH